MAKVRDVARLFIDIADKQAENECGDGMSNLKLQKLLYFAQGWYMARYGKPLFDAPMEAWRLGPVVPSVYSEYQCFGKNAIHDDPPADDAFTQDEFDLLMDVVREYWKYSTSALIDMSHQNGAPWEKAYTSGVPHIELSNKDIMEYFKSQRPLPSFNDILTAAMDRIHVVSPVGYTESGAAIFRAEAKEAWGIYG